MITWKYIRFSTLNTFCKYVLRQSQLPVPGKEFSTSSYQRSDGKLHPVRRFCTASHSETVDCYDILTHFKSIIENQQHAAEPSDCDDLLKTCATKLWEFRDEELVQLMKYLRVIKREKRINVNYDYKLGSALISHLDHVCGQHVLRWDIKECLDILSTYRTLRNFRDKQFAYNTFKRHHSRISSYPMAEVTRLLELTSCEINWNKFSFSTYNIQHYLEEKFDALNADDMSVYLSSLLQFQRPIVNPRLKEMLLKKFVAEVPSMKRTTARTFLYCFCFLHSFNKNAIHCTRYAIEIANYFAENSDETLSSNLAYVGLLSCRFLVYHPPLLERIRVALAECTSAKGILNTECAFFTLSFFDYPCFGVLNAETVEKLKQNRPKHPRRTVNLVWHLANAGVYHSELIDLVLREDSLKSAYGEKLCRYSVPREIFMLDAGVEIECGAEYTGTRLKAELRNALNSCFLWDYPNAVLLSNTRPYSWKHCYADPYTFGPTTDASAKFPPSRLHYDDILVEAATLFNELYGEGYAALCHILHHFPRPNLLLSFDESGRKLRKINVSSAENLLDWRRMDMERRWLVFTVLVRNSTTEDAVPLDNEVAKVRQFKKLGFNVIGIVQDDWLEMSAEKKREFLRKSLES